jgi:gluconokinase
MSGGFVVMGVSGCGKSHIGAAFARAIGARFIDGDDLHPAANIAKMRGGTPLDDTDRAPWLDEVGGRLEPGVVIACSALKRSYRDQIRRAADGPVTFLFLRGTRETLIARMSDRPGHFMPASLLESQLATLQPPDADEAFLVADIEDTPEEIVKSFQSRLDHMPRP